MCITGVHTHMQTTLSVHMCEHMLTQKGYEHGFIACQPMCSNSKSTEYSLNCCTWRQLQFKPATWFDSWSMSCAEAYERVHLTLGIVPLAKPMMAIWPPHLSVFSASVKGTPPTGSNTTSIPANTSGKLCWQHCHFVIAVAFCSSGLSQLFDQLVHVPTY